METVIVFKTNASKNKDLNRLQELMSRIPGIISWNFDFEDCDKIFRVVSTGIEIYKVKQLLAELEIEAVELED